MVEETKRNVILPFAKPKCLFRTTFRKKTKNEEEKKKKEEENERKKMDGYYCETINSNGLSFEY